MGVGAALIMPSTLAIITDIFHGPGRAPAGASGSGRPRSGVGFALGPIIGGLLLAHFWWGSVFLINVPIAAAGILCALQLVPDSTQPDGRAGRTSSGRLLSVIGLGLVLWAIIEAPVHGWSSPDGLSAGAAGLLVLAAFVLWERRSAHPMLNLILPPPRLLGSRHLASGS